MDYDEEQSDEIEALESIYDTDVNVLSRDPPRRLKVALEPGVDEVHVKVLLDVTYPDTYPEVVPVIDVISEKGLDAAGVEALSAVISSCAEENVGEASVFTIAEAVKEWLEENNRDMGDGSMHQQMMDRIRAKNEAKEAEAAKLEEEDAEKKDNVSGKQKVLDGTPVNAETFAAWRMAFEAETSDDPVSKTAATKPTGREFFERQSAGGVKEDEEEDDAAAAAEAIAEDAERVAAEREGLGVEATGVAGAGAIDESLFIDEEDDDDELDDLDDD